MNMHNINTKYLLILFLFGINLSLASDFNLNLVCIEGESGKDSWSSTTTININRNSITYLKEYTGHSKEKNESKTGELNEDQIQKIVELIVNDKLNITDSITDYTEKINSNYSQYTTVTLTIFMQGAPNTIKIDGDNKSLKGVSAYKSAMELLDFLKDFLDNI
jgi:hypothetical protein